MDLIEPHGGELVGLVVDADRARELKREAVGLPEWDLGLQQVWDIELLLNGAFSPLRGFMGKVDYERVCEEMRLADGTLWPIPITLDVTEEFAGKIGTGARVALRHPEGMVLAVLTVSDIWRPDLESEGRRVYGTDDDAHPGVFHLRHDSHPVYVGGALEGVELPAHHTFKGLRHTPAQLRARFRDLGWSRIVAFQTRNPMHRAHVEMTRRAAEMHDANLLIHPVVGRTKPGDVDYFSRVRCYREVLAHYPPQTTELSLLPLAMRMAGPREALWHAIIRKNYGCSHLVVGRDHAGPGLNGQGEAFYGPYDAQELVRKYRDEIGIEMVAFEEMVYVEDLAQYMPRSEAPEGTRILAISGTELRRRLREGLELPGWFTYPEVERELRTTYPSRDRQGFTVFFTGLSGAGKSTVANVLVAKLMEIDSRPVTLLDGDIVRKNLSSELGFSREHRDLNIQRIGFVASEITKNRGTAICAPIAPYAATRRRVREAIEDLGGFVEVYVSTPLEVCEQRDRKGMYAKARAGIIKGFTGIDDPYEAPESPEVEIDTSAMSPDEAVNAILLHLEKEGYLARD